MIKPSRPEWTDVRDGETWQGLRLDLPQSSSQGLRVEVTGGRRILIRQNGSAVLAARVETCLGQVDYVRGNSFQPVVPPVRADHATRAGLAPPGERAATWAYHFASALTESSCGPLHAGRWLLEPAAPFLSLRQRLGISVQDQWDEIVISDRFGDIDWYFLNGAAVILCSRDLSPLEDGRVKAYRKQVREGIVAPILLWWISGLTSYLLLDGHDRLRACLAEGVAPPLLALSRLSEDVPSDLGFEVSRHAMIVRHIERAISRAVPGAAEALIIERRRFGRALEKNLYRPTRAWPLPGAAPAWRSAAHALDPAWLAAVDPHVACV